MDKSSGANTTQGAAGQNSHSSDFEVHPVGTAERLRQLGIIGARAAEILEGLAQDLKDSESINGEWPDDPEAAAAQIEYDEWTATAGFLRALCTPAASLDPAHLPLCPPFAPTSHARPVFTPPRDGLRDEDFTVQIYPWPSGEVVVDD